MTIHFNERAHKLSDFFAYLQNKKIELSESEKKSIESIFTDIADKDKSGELETHKEKSDFWFGIIQNLKSDNPERRHEISSMFFDFWGETFKADFQSFQNEKKQQNKK